MPSGQTSATGTVRTIEDNRAEGNESFQIIIASGLLPAGVAAVAPSISNVIILDNDAVTISETDSGTSVTEATGAGRTDTYTVVLAIAPTHDVTITPTSGDTGAATVSPGTLTFTTSTYNTAQTVTVTGVDDNVDQTGNRSATISHSATSTDAKYNGTIIANVTATVVDNDTPAVNISPATVSVTEASGAGRTDTYTVVLATQPTHSVTIIPTSETPAAATVSPGTLTFTTSTWSVAQTVTVTGVDDNVDQSSNRSATISHTATSTDTDYSGINIDDVTATVVDNDTAGATISASDGISVTEAAGTTNTESYTVVLDTLPTASVEIAVASDATAIATVSPATLTFTTSTWSVAQTVTVTGVDDNVDQSSNRSATISHTATSTDTDYSGINIDDVTATVVDNDTAGATISASDGISVTEAAGTTNTESYTVVLDTLPTASVEIAVASDATAIATVSPATLTFTTANWNTPQTVTVTGVDDNVDQSNNRSATISHTATSTDTDYSGINIDDVTATVVDDDGAGVTINETGTPKEARVTEAAGSGNTDTYTVVLDTEPTESVIIAAISDDPAAARVSPATLMFTTSNYNTAQTVTVTGVNNSTDNPGGGREVSISHAVSSADPKYTISSGGTVEAMVRDDDATTVTLSGAAGNIEEGETKEFTITLGRGLVNGEILTVSLTFGGTATRNGDYTLSGTSATGVQYNNLDSGDADVVFTGPDSGATATGATITLSATADNTVENPAETVNIGLGDITHTGLSNAGGVTQTARLGEFTIADADGSLAGVGITESGGFTSVTEAAGPTNTDTYTVVLATQPTHEVTITPTSDTPAAATVSPGTLRFTTINLLF